MPEGYEHHLMREELLRTDKDPFRVLGVSNEDKMSFMRKVVSFFISLAINLQPTEKFKNLTASELRRIYVSHNLSKIAS